MHVYIRVSPPRLLSIVTNVPRKKMENLPICLLFKFRFMYTADLFLPSRNRDLAGSNGKFS